MKVGCRSFTIEFISRVPKPYPLPNKEKIGFPVLPTRDLVALRAGSSRIRESGSAPPLRLTPRAGDPPPISLLASLSPGLTCDAAGAGAGAGLLPHGQEQDSFAGKGNMESEMRAANPNISKIDKANVNIDYSFTGDTKLKPSMVFDDGKKTFFKFTGRTPAIFAVNSDFSETLRNFRKEGEYLVVDGTATQYTLRDGDQWICIFNLRKPDFGAPDPDIMGPAPDQVATKRRRSGN